MNRSKHVPLLPLDAWISASLRRTVIALAVGLIVLGTGVLWWLHVDGRTSARVAHGRPVEAQVVSVRWPKTGRTSTTQKVTVRYEVDGRQFEESLMSVLETRTYRVGGRVTVYVEPDDPTRVATADGLASEGWGMQIPLYITILGGIVVLVTGLARVTCLVRRSHTVQ